MLWGVHWPRVLGYRSILPHSVAICESSNGCYTRPCTVPSPPPGTGSPASGEDWPCSLPPGLLVAYCHRFDIQVQSSRVYFVACTIGKHPFRKAGLRP